MTEETNFLDRLSRCLAGDRQVEPDRPGFQRAGVLVPLIVGGEKQELLFTRRTDTVETHKGQISFPGGVVDAADEDIVATAIRELEEETGIPAREVRTVGLLDDLATPTGFLITPVVGLFDDLPTVTPNPDEVAEVFSVPLEFFYDTRNRTVERHTLHGVEREGWRYTHSGRTIWGATAVIIRSLLMRLERT
jgi:8-oxo-dGTP pyrophosphatase MutT (NUDIX family)